MAVKYVKCKRKFITVKELCEITSRLSDEGFGESKVCTNSFGNLEIMDADGVNITAYVDFTDGEVCWKIA